MPVCMGAKQASKQESKKAGKQGSKRANKGAGASGPLLSLDSGDPENLPFHIALFSSHFNHHAHPPGGPPMLGRAIDRSVGLHNISNKDISAPFLPHPLEAHHYFTIFTGYRQLLP